MTIREATLADAEPVCQMAIRFLTETAYGDYVQPDEVKIAQLLLQCLDLGVIYVAELEDEPKTIIGFIAIVALVHPVSGDPFAEELAWWVEPEARHLSIGPRLLKQAEGWARSHDLRMLKMVAPAGTTNTVGAYYERCGYAFVEATYIKQFAAAPQLENGVARTP